MDPHSVITEFTKQMYDMRGRSLGFPNATDIDYSPLAELFAGCLLNNVGDPYPEDGSDGVWAMHSKPFERDVLAWLHTLFSAPLDDRWGYITGSGSEGNLTALLAARDHLGRDAMVYYFTSAHYSIPSAVHVLGLDSVRVRTRGERDGADVRDLQDQINAHRHRPAIVVATIGTTFTEAFDPVTKIRLVLDELGVRSHIHVDAALSGLPLALALDEEVRPSFDFSAGADSLCVSFHKFFGTPAPCGAVLMRRSRRPVLALPEYTGSPHTTIGGSRSGHLAIMVWWALQIYGETRLRLRAEAAWDLARYAKQQLDVIGWPSFRNAFAATVVLTLAPPKTFTDKWVLATEPERNRSHIITMPGMTQARIDEFVGELAKLR